MIELEKLNKRLLTAIKKEDLQKIDATRAKIIEHYPDSHEAGEARYRLGLSMLLQHKDLLAAQELFQAAASSQDPLYGPMGRISLALMLHAQKKEQKALFELRKVVGSRKPSAQSVVALGFIVTIMGDMGAKVAEVKRARSQQIEHLRAVLDQTEQASERAALLMQLGLALYDQRETQEAGTCLQALLDLGDQADDEQRAVAQAVLAELK